MALTQFQVIEPFFGSTLALIRPNPFNLTTSPTCSNFAFVITNHTYSCSLGSTPNKSPGSFRTPIPSRLSDHLFSASLIAIGFSLCGFSCLFVALDRPPTFQTVKPAPAPGRRRFAQYPHNNSHNKVTEEIRPTLVLPTGSALYFQKSRSQKNKNSHIKFSSFRPPFRLARCKDVESTGAN